MGNQPAIKRYLFCACLIIVIFVVDLAIPLGVAGGVPYITVILFSLWLNPPRSTILLSVICSALTIFGLFYSPPGGEIWKVLFNRFLALFAIWVTAILMVQRNRLEEKRERAVSEREKALSDIKVLRGLLPICASCKKIRDDKGYWNQIEKYIFEHSEAGFTHGLCPECARKLYPELYEKAE